jgi:L-iditol 2-dehydrogenase
MEHGLGHVACVDIPEPVAGPGKLKIKVAFCGICGTDDHIVRHGLETPSGLDLPVTLGHEYGGTVVEVGEGVSNFKVGDRVTTGGLTGWCGQCYACKSLLGIGACKSARSIGYEVDGAMAEYIVHEEGYAFKIPDNMSFEEAAIIEPSAVACHAVLEVADVKPSDSVVIFGAGPIGLLVLQYVKLCGARAYLVDVAAAAGRLQKANAFGADAVFENDKVNAIGEIMKLNGGPADCCFDCTSQSSCIDQAFLLTRFAGNVYLVGTPDMKEGYTFKLAIAAFMKEIAIKNAFAHRQPTWPKAIRLMAEGKINAKDMITHRFSFDECEKAFYCGDPDKIKVLLHP